MPDTKPEHVHVIQPNGALAYLYAIHKQRDVPGDDADFHVSVCKGFSFFGNAAKTMENVSADGFKSFFLNG